MGECRTTIMENRKEKRLADLLSQSLAAGMPEMEEITDLINDYFLDDAETTIDSDDNSNNVASEDEQDVNELTHVEPLLPQLNAPVDEESDLQTEVDLSECDDKEDAPLVHVDDTFGHGEMGDCADNRMHQAHDRAANFACRCTQIKVASGQNHPPHQNRGCIAQFTTEEVVATQLNMQDMTRDELDMFIMGMFNSNMHHDSTTVSSRKKGQTERVRTRTDYIVMNRLVCKKTFFFLTGIGDKRLRNVMAHYKKEGPCQRQSKRGGRKNNTRALTLAETYNVYRFILNYAEDNAVSLPGRVPGFHRDDILLLPSSTPKSQVHRHFLDSAAAAGLRPVAASTFRKIWAALLPFVVVARPMTDLCWICQKNMHHIYRSANLSDEEKGELLMAQQSHLSRVEEERRLYKTMTAASKAVVQELGIRELGSSPHNSRNCSMHYSFDFAQVHLPHSPYQPGPLYFLTPRKVGIFGVCCEGVPQQINYLTDEGATSSKGSNAVLSYLHHFFNNYGLGEQNCDLHCDNCAGQNKNRFVLWYCAWRVMTGKHTSIALHFMPPGHTKFAPDWCFGLLKRAFRRSEVHCLQDPSDVVRNSTPVKHVNRAQVVKGEAQDARPQVDMFDWQGFFGNHFRTMPGIKKIGHFRFPADRPGCMMYRETLADEETAFCLIDEDRVATVLRELPNEPPIMPPPGLSLERQNYLFKNIRSFVRVDARDTLTPEPRM